MRLDLTLSNCWIYGLGTSGRLFADICLRNGISISGIIVGNGYKDEETYRNIKIYEIDGVNQLQLRGETLVYTVKMEKEELLKQLNWDKSKIIDMSSLNDYRDMLSEFYQRYFEEKDISIEIEKEKIINMGSCRMLNPKKCGKSYWDAFLSEIGDLVLPIVWNDYSRIDEGNYEYSQVQLEKEDVVIDCGANLGVFSAVAAWKGTKVYAFEPIEEAFTYLQSQAEIYEGKIFPIKCALTDYTGTGEISVGAGEHMTESSFRNQVSSNLRTINCTTIDNFVKENYLEKVDFIKADIEGCERQMLLGAVNTLKNSAPKLAICTYHRPDDREVLTKIILDANPNYQIQYKWKKLYAYVNGNKK